MSTSKSVKENQSQLGDSTDELGMQCMPVGWTSATLGDVIELKYGKSLPARDRDNKGFPVYGSNGIVGRHSEPLISGPAIIIGRKGSVGEIHVSEGPCSPIDTTYYIDNFYGQPIQYWYHYLKSLPLETLNRATAIPGLNRSDAYKVRVTIPPLSEQCRIFPAIEAIQKRSQQVRRLLSDVEQLLEQFRKSVLAAAFRGELTAHWRRQNSDVESATEFVERISTLRRQKWEQREIEKQKTSGQKPPKDWQTRYREPAEVEATESSRLPEGWRYTTFETLTEFITSGSRGWSKYYSDEGARFVRAQNIKSDDLILDDVAHVSPPKGSEGTRTQIQKDDLLVTITGANVTKAAHVRVDLGEAYVNQHVALARLVDPKLAAYVHLWTVSENGGRPNFSNKRTETENQD